MIHKIDYRQILICFAVGFAFFLYEFFFGHLSAIVHWILGKRLWLLPEFFIFVLTTALVLLWKTLAYIRLSISLDEKSQQLNNSRIEKIMQRYRNFSEAVVHGNEAERMRLARELHDDTIHRLILLGQKIELMKHDNPDNVLFSKLDEASGIVDDTISNARGFIKQLRPTYLQKLGLSAALRALTKDKTESSGIKIDFILIGEAYSLKEESELTVYRLSQSALQNIALHSEATSASLEISFEKNEIKLTITDNGKGFEVPNHDDLFDRGNFGLLGMKERAHMCNGSFIINSVIGMGTSIVIKIPREGNEV